MLLVNDRLWVKNEVYSDTIFLVVHAKYISFFFYFFGKKAVLLEETNWQDRAYYKPHPGSHQQQQKPNPQEGNNGQQNPAAGKYLN